MAISFTAYQLNQFRREAKQLSRDHSIVYGRVLDSIAKRYGFSNWAVLIKHSKPEKSKAASPVPAAAPGHSLYPGTLYFSRAKVSESGFGEMGVKPFKVVQRVRECHPQNPCEALRQIVLHALESTRSPSLRRLALVVSAVTGLAPHRVLKMVYAEASSEPSTLGDLEEVNPSRIADFLSVKLASRFALQQRYRRQDVTDGGAREALSGGRRIVLLGPKSAGDDSGA